MGNSDSSSQPDLFGKTFDQQLEILDGSIEGEDISPNRCIPSEIVFEPVLNGVRVTARDDNHRLLWGFIGSKGMMKQIHCPVAVYEKTCELLDEELSKNNVPNRNINDPIKSARKALDSLEETIEKLRKSIRVKNVSDATIERAKIIYRLAKDADKMILLEAVSFIGIEGKGEEEDN